MKFTNGLIKKIPGKVLTKINQKVGFRFITKFGTKGIVNLGKLLPGVGAIVGGGLDLVETKIIAERAYKWFFEGDFSVKDGSEEEVIEMDDIEDWRVFVGESIWRISKKILMNPWTVTSSIVVFQLVLTYWGFSDNIIIEKVLPIDG